MADLKNKLYGDGIHDDLPAIQEMLDSGMTLVYLPPVGKNYLITGTIYMHSNQELRLDRYTTIRLAPNSNCSMIEDAGDREWNENISVSGGIWDMNGGNQAPNPYHFITPGINDDLLGRDYYKKINYTFEADYKMPGYTGFCFRFYKVKGFSFSNLTIKNPVTYGLQIAYVDDFTVENIYFDYKIGTPKLWNMDGVHVEGYCSNGYIRNLKGICHDDMVAITSDDGCFGPIENVVVDGVYAYNTHSAVRLLSRINPVKNIHVTNIYGSYYVYCVSLSKYTTEPGVSGFENITIDNVYASICEGTKDVKGNYSPLITIGPDIELKGIKLANIFRNETRCPKATIGIGKNTVVKDLSVINCVQTNETDNPITFLENNGRIDNLFMVNNDAGGDELLGGEGTVNKITNL